MTREEIKKAIENGESVWYIVNNGLAEIDLGCNFHEIKDNELLTWYDKYSKDYYTHRTKLEDLFKTKAEAEHYLHHANVTRTETLPFLTWEEFLESREIIFITKKYETVMLGILNNKLILAIRGKSLYNYWDLTEANFYKAYDECVRLFRGNKNYGRNSISKNSRKRL